MARMRSSVLGAGLGSAARLAAGLGLGSAAGAARSVVDSGQVARASSARVSGTVRAGEDDMGGCLRAGPELVRKRRWATARPWAVVTMKAARGGGVQWLCRNYCRIAATHTSASGNWGFSQVSRDPSAALATDHRNLAAAAGVPEGMADWADIRRLGLIAGVVLLAVAAYAWWYSADWRQRFEVWNTEVLTRLAVAPASTQEVTAILEHTCEVAHGQQILLRVLTADGAVAPPAAWPEHLHAVVSTERIDGSSPQKFVEPFACAELLEGANPDHGVMLTRSILGEAGRYRLRVLLTRPHEAPEGVVYEISVRNELCGMELLPSTFAFVTALLCGGLGLACAAPGVMRAMRRNELPTACESRTCVQTKTKKPRPGGRGLGSTLHQQPLR
jgi:hypothetical protein